MARIQLYSFQMRYHASNMLSRFCSVPGAIMVQPKRVNSTTGSPMALLFPVLLHSGLEEFHQPPLGDTNERHVKNYIEVATSIANPLTL